MRGSIYVIQNKINGKCYVGQTRGTPKERFQQHLRLARKGEGYVLHAAIRKHGEINFSIIETFDVEIEQLNEIERDAVLRHNSCQPNGYNILDYGSLANLEEGWWKGKTRPEETKQKISETKTGTQVGENNPFYGKVHSEESKSKMSTSQSEAWARKLPEQKERESQQRREISREMWESLTAEERSTIGKKISEANKGRKPSPESIEKNRQSHLGKKASEETKQKMSQSQIGKVRTEEAIATYTLSNRAKVSEESKLRIKTILELLEQKIPVSEIAKQTGVHPSYVYAIKNGVSGNSVTEGRLKKEKTKKKGANRNSSEAIERKIKIYQLAVDGVPRAEIARTLGCSDTYVSKVLNEKKINPTAS